MLAGEKRGRDGQPEECKGSVAGGASLASLQVTSSTTTQKIRCLGDRKCHLQVLEGGCGADRVLVDGAAGGERKSHVWRRYRCTYNI